MTLVYGLGKALSMDARGRVGWGLGFGVLPLGLYRLGTADPLNATYSHKHTKKGVQLSAMIPYQPSNPRTVPQQARRTKFAAGVVLYHALTPEEKTAYNKAGNRRRLSGFNYFMSKHMRS